MNTNLISKISKKISDIIKNIKDCNKKYEETKEKSWQDMKRKYILDLALNFANLEHEYNYKILYRFKKEDLSVLEDICHNCMNLYKIESSEESNIKAFDMKYENLTLDMINNVNNSLLNLENNLNKIMEIYPYKPDKELSNLNEKNTSLKNFIKQIYENFTKQIYNIKNKSDYYEYKYTLAQFKFFKEREYDSIDKLSLELTNFESIKNSEIGKTFNKETLEKLDEIIHFSKELITLKNQKLENTVERVAKELRSFISFENKDQGLELK